MNFFELIEKRVSCRAYLPTPVEAEKLLRCVEAARRAPSARNMQPWHFITVRDPDKRKEIARLVQKDAGGRLNSFADEVPAYIVLCGTPEIPPPDTGFPPPKNNYTQNDLGIAVSYLLLAATELGLGSCMIGWFDEPDVRAALPVPSGYTVHGIIALGYPKNESPSQRPRRPLAAMLTEC